PAWPLPLRIIRDPVSCASRVVVDVGGGEPALVVVVEPPKTGWVVAGTPDTGLPAPGDPEPLAPGPGEVVGLGDATFRVDPPPGEPALPRWGGRPAGEPVEPMPAVVDPDSTANRLGWCPSVPATACSAPAVTAPATVTVAAAARPIVATACPIWGKLPTKGSEPSQANGPATGRIRPMEISRKARTTLGSKCEPAQAASSFRAASRLIGCR